LRVAAGERELARWGYHCAGRPACDENCTGGKLYDVDWTTCPIGVARSSPRVRVLRAVQTEKRVCGTLRAEDLPAWVLRDLDDLTAWERYHGTDGGTH
jgi:hypothetical protein